MTENTNPHSDTNANVEAVQRLYAAVGRGDVDAILEELDDEVDWAAEAASTSAPWYGNYRGKAEVPRFFEALAKTIDIDEFSPVTYTWNDTDVMVPVRFAYTVRATGKTTSMTMQHWWRLAGAKIVFFRGAEDSEQSVAALS